MEIPLGLQHVPESELARWGPGHLHVGIFYQVEIWVDVQAQTHRLEDMPAAYRQAVIGHCRENAGYFHQAQQLYRSLDRLETVLDGMPIVEPDPLPKDPITWVESTPLLRRLRELEDGPQPDRL